MVHNGLRDLVLVGRLDGVAGVAPVELEHRRNPGHVARLDDLEPPHGVALLVGLEVEVELGDAEHVAPGGVQPRGRDDVVDDLLHAALRAERDALGLLALVLEHDIDRVLLGHVLLGVEQAFIHAAQPG